MATHERIVPIAKHSIISSMMMSDAFKNYYKEAIEISTISLARYDEKLTDMAHRMAAHNIVHMDELDGHPHQSIFKH